MIKDQWIWSKGGKAGRTVLGEAELGEPTQWAQWAHRGGSVSTGPAGKDAAVLGVTAMLGTTVPDSRGGPAPALPANQQGSGENR